MLLRDAEQWRGDDDDDGDISRAYSFFSPPREPCGEDLREVSFLFPLLSLSRMSLIYLPTTTTTTSSQERPAKLDRLDEKTKARENSGAGKTRLNEVNKTGSFGVKAIEWHERKQSATINITLKDER